MSAETSIFDPAAFQQWDERTQQRAAEELQKRLERPPRFFYCTRGRTCDGKPHEGFDYKHARGDQWPPPGEDWFVWALLSGRGAGKTRSGCEWVRKMSERVPAIGLIGRRGVDVRDTMIEGIGEDPENGAGLIHACERAGIGYKWEPSKKLFTFDNGCVAIGISAEEPDSLRGKNFGAAWLDEPAHMPLITDVWAMLRLTLRQKRAVGRSHVLVTTTPLPIVWLKDLVQKETTRVTKVSTYANRENLDEAFATEILGDFEGTRLGRQEIHGDILEDVEGAMWNSGIIDPHRNMGLDLEITPMERIVVAVDPAGGGTRRSDETGIVVVGKIGEDFYVLEDASARYTPNQWAEKVRMVYDKWHADRVVVEKNYGGEMVEPTLRNAAINLPITSVVSRRGKVLRAEPIVALYEQGRVHHAGVFEQLETQMTTWLPGDSSPDRVDALVHGLTNLAGKGGGQMGFAAPTSGPRGPRVPGRTARAFAALPSRT